MALNIIFELFRMLWALRGYMIALLMFVLGIRFKSSKYLTFLYGIYCWILIGLNTVSADYDAFKEMYYCCFAERYSGHEPGYLALCKLFYSLGFSFEAFRAIAGAIIVIILISGIKKITPKTNYVLSLMLIFPLVSLVSGLRNSFSYVIMLHGMYYLLNGVNSDNKFRKPSRFRVLLKKKDLPGNKNDERKKLLKFIFCVIIATMFHYSSLFYLVFLYAKYSKKKTTSLMVQTLAIVSIVIVMFQTGLLFRIISRLTSREKTLNWFPSSSTAYVSPLYIVTLALFGILLFLLYRCRVVSELRGLTAANNTSAINKNNILVISRIMVVSFLAFAGAVGSSVVFLRLVILPIPLSYCAFSECLTVYQGDSYRVQREVTIIRLFIYGFAALAALFVYGYWIGGNNLQQYINNLVFA